MNNLRTVLNDINRYSAAFSTSVGNLTINEKYKVERLEKVTTKYGPSVIAYISKGGDTLWKLYLPKKFVNSFDAEFITNFNKHEVGELYLTYKGQLEKTFDVVYF